MITCLHALSICIIFKDYFGSMARTAWDAGSKHGVCRHAENVKDSQLEEFE